MRHMTAQLPKTIMDDLQSRFGQVNKLALASLLDQFHSLMCTSDKKILSHLDRLTDLRDRINATKADTITDDVYAAAIIRSVLSAYKELAESYERAIEIQNLTTTAQVSLSPTNLIALMRAKASANVIDAKSSHSSGDSHSKNSSKDKGKKTDQVNQADGNTRGRGGGRGGRGRGRGQGCGGRGGGQQSDNGSRTSKLQCFKCKGYGHKQDVYPSPEAAPKDQAKSAEDGKADAKAKPDTTPSVKIVEADDDWDGDLSALSEDCDVTIDDALHIQYNTITEIYDSGATFHMTPYCHLLENYKDIPERRVKAAGKSYFSAKGMGTMKVQVPNGELWCTFTLRNILYAPEMSAMLVSLGRFDDTGFIMVIGNGKMDILCNSKLVFSVPKLQGLYRVYYRGDVAFAASSCSTNFTVNLDTCRMAI